MADAINIELMAESGCIGIKFGIESGSKKILQKLGKPVNLDKAREIINICAKNNIKTHGTFSIGLLGETEETYCEILNYLKGFNSDSIQVSICTPFPGTKFFENAVKENLVKTLDWSKYYGKATEIISHKNISDVEKKRSLAIRVWLLNRLITPSWILRQIKYFVRLLKGLGISFIISQLLDIVKEEIILVKKD